jgi:NAD(P)-dependent dehydrogenase (short-subunit alcohol dehydrogenase family)
MNKQFDTKSVLITGGNSGLGKAIAIAFAREGARVALAARRISEGEETLAIIKDLGGEAIFIEADVSDSEQVKAMVDSCVSKFGGLDCAVNNAGILGTEFTPVADYEEKVWDQVIDINLKGVWLCMKYQIPEMLKQGGGSILNMSSVAGLKGGRVGCAYYASKHGVIGLTKAAAIEYASQGIRVNAVCPAVIETPMAETAFQQDQEMEARIIGMHPIGRLGQPEEVAAAALWLCSDSASFVTGIAHPVDGGYLL